MRTALLIFSSCLMGRYWFEGKHMRHVFCFHPSLIELQRAGSVCVMKFVLVICFHTLQPAAFPPTAASSHVLVHELQQARTQAWAGRWRAANVQAAPTSREHVCMTASHLSNMQAQMNTSVSIFLHKAHFRIKASHMGVFSIPHVLKQKVSSIIYFAWLFCWNLRSGSDLFEGKSLRSSAQMDRRLSYGEPLLGP